MKNSSENEKTKIGLKFCPVKPAQEHLKCNSQKRQNRLEQNSNHQSAKVTSENIILSLNSVANPCKRKAVQTKINAVSVTENKLNFSYVYSSIFLVRDEIGSLEKQKNKNFSSGRKRNDILKFNEELEKPRSALVENYSDVVPKKLKICSTMRKLSRHKRASEMETGNFLKILVVGLLRKRTL